jgi:radical SAM/Cys-rich protein
VLPREVGERVIALLQSAPDVGVLDLTGGAPQLNPGGAFLPPDQAELEDRYRAELREHFGIEFTRLLTLTNLPVKRFAEALARDSELETYLELLESAFSPATVDGLMCRNLLSVSWDGRLFDCDFNQMLEVEIGAGPPAGLTVFELRTLGSVAGAPIATAGHCLGCTAGAGSSCGGALL